MRMLAWINLLSPGGYGTRFLDTTGISSVLYHLGVISDPNNYLGGESFTVILALIYGYIPYFILPLYASLDRIDSAHLEAARDLGASPFRTFLHVTLPLSKTGLLGGAVLIVLPMFGDYYTPNIVSGAPTTSMIGNQIDLYFHGGPQPTIGAAITLLLSAFLVVLMAYYMYTIHRATRDIPA
jgi:spermidine/putrescine transport system permease protein